MQLGQAIRRASASGLREVASTRVLVATGQLARAGLGLRAAAYAAVAQPLTDDPSLVASLRATIDAYL